MSRGLRAVAMAHGLIYLGLLVVVMRFFFPHVLFRPVAVTAAVLYLAACIARVQAVLDPAAGEVTLIAGPWTKHVRLTQVERVTVARSGVEIRIADGVSYGIGPLRERRWPWWHPAVRSGFEEMDLAIMQASAATRAADPVRAATEDAASRRAASRSKVLAASFACGAGLLSLAAAAVIQPRAAGWLVHAVAVLLRIYLG